MAVANSNPIVQANKTLGYQPGTSTVSLSIPAPTDPDGDSLRINIYTLPSWGTIRKADGTPVTAGMSLTPAEVAGLVYSVDPTKSGNAGSFTYGVSDGKGGFSYQVVTLDSAAPAAAAAKIPTPPPAPVNHAPVAQADKALAVTVGQQASLSIAAPTDADGDSLSIKITSVPSKGGVFLSNGQILSVGQTITAAQLTSLVYKAPSSTLGAMGAFSYQVADGKGGVAQQSVGINIVQPAAPPPPVNHAPVADADKAITMAWGGTTPLGIHAPTDADGDALTIKITSIPQGGSLTLADNSVVQTGQMLTATQLAGLQFKAPATGGTIGAATSFGNFSYSVSDGHGGATAQTVSLFGNALVNHAPVADSDKAITMAWGGTVPLGIHSPTDADGDALTIKITSIPQGGSLTLADNSLVQNGQMLTATQLAGLQFKAPATGGTIGAATAFGNFSYSVSDGHGGATAQTVSLFGNPINTANPPATAAGGVIALARDAYVARPGGILTLGEMIKIPTGTSMPGKITIVGSDNNHYAGAETYNYGTLTAKTGVSYAGGFTLTFSLINGQYVTTQSASMTSTNNLTLSDFVFSASSQENPVQSFQVTAFDHAGTAMEQRTVSVLTSSLYSDPTPGIAGGGEMAQIAQTFIGQTWDVNGCWNLVNAISLRAGASLDLDASGGPYQQNVGTNGQWGVAYNAAKGTNANWLSTVQAGDVLEWTPKNANFAHAAVVSRVTNGQVYIVDNGGPAATGPGTDGADVLVTESNLTAQVPYIDPNSILVMRLSGAAPTVGNLAPTVSVGYNNDLQIGQTVSASSLFKASDPDNSAITAYQFRDTSNGGGSFFLNGVKQADGQWVNVSAAQLSSLTYTAGAKSSVDTIQVQAYDGQAWSNVANGRAITLGSQTVDDSSSTPTKLGQLSSSTPTLTATDVLSRNDIQDFYSFTLANAATVTFSLSDLSADCQLDVYGPAGSGYQASSVKGGTQDESITAALAAGTYLVRAAYTTGGPQTNATNYDLAISVAVPAAPVPPSNQPPTLVAGG